MLLIPVDECKKEEKTLAPSSAMVEIVVDITQDNQISDEGEGVKQKEVLQKMMSVQVCFLLMIQKRK